MAYTTGKLVIIMIADDNMRRCNGALGGILWQAMMVVDQVEVRIEVLAYLVSG